MMKNSVRTVPYAFGKMNQSDGCAAQLGGVYEAYEEGRWEKLEKKEELMPPEFSEVMKKNMTEDMPLGDQIGERTEIKN